MPMRTSSRVTSRPRNRTGPWCCGPTGVSTAVRIAPQELLEVPSADLPRRRSGELVHDPDHLRHLERGEMLPRRLLHPVGVDLSLDERRQDLTVLGVRDPDHRRLADPWHALDDLLDLRGVDVLPADHDHVVGATLDVQPASL